MKKSFRVVIIISIILEILAFSLIFLTKKILSDTISNTYVKDNYAGILATQIRDMDFLEREKVLQITNEFSQSKEIKKVALVCLDKTVENILFNENKSADVEKNFKNTINSSKILNEKEKEKIINNFDYKKFDILYNTGFNIVKKNLDKKYYILFWVYKILNNIVTKIVLFVSFICLLILLFKMSKNIYKDLYIIFLVLSLFGIIIELLIKSNVEKITYAVTGREKIFDFTIMSYLIIVYIIFAIIFLILNYIKQKKDN